MILSIVNSNLDSVAVTGQEKTSQSQVYDLGLEEKALETLNGMNPDDATLPISLTVCVRCQLTTSFELDIDEDHESLATWNPPQDEDWVLLHFRTLLHDFDWKIVKFFTDDEVPSQ
jgi:hypothetical protein